MNRITISLIFLMMISMILPASAIMYASGSPQGSDDGSSSDNGSTDTSDDGSSSDNGSTDTSDDGSSSDNGSTDTSDDGSSPDGSDSTDGNADVTTTFTENTPTLSSESTLSNNTGNVQGGDRVNSILTVHIDERAAVGV